MTTSWATAARDVPGLEHDPCPGDVAGVRALAAGLRARAEEVVSAVAACRAWQPTRWQGEAAGRAQDAVASLVAVLAPVGGSLDGAAAVLDGWAGDLGAMQAEAAALGAAAQELHRRELLQTLAAGVPASPSEAVLLQDRLADGRRRLQAQVDELHARWLACSRRRSAELDAAAPPSPAPGWRSAWDLAHDGYQGAVRHSARPVGWVAGPAGVVSAAAGLTAVVCPGTAPLTVPLSLALAGVSAHAHLVLATGADGSGEDAALAVAGALGGATLGVLAAAARGGPVLHEVVDGLGTASDAAAVAGGAAAVVAPRRSDTQAPGGLPGLDGGTVELTVHDVARPWHVGHGMQGAGFVGVAVVPVPSGSQAPAARAAPPAPPAPASPSSRTTTAPGPAGRPERDRTDVRPRRALRPAA